MADLTRPATYAKAIAGAALAAATCAIPLVDDGLTPSEGLSILVAALTVLAGVWAIPNAKTGDQLDYEDELRAQEPPVVPERALPDDESGIQSELPSRGPIYTPDPDRVI